jgi:hypothetical protein
MNKAIRISISMILISGAIALIVFALPLLSGFSIVGIGAFLLLLMIGVLIAWSGIEIVQGASIREVFANLFRMLGR